MHCSQGMVKRRRIMSADNAMFSKTTSSSLGLQTSLSSFWEFSDAGSPPASWVDSIVASANDLTPHGSSNPPSGTGIVGNDVVFTGTSSQYLSHVNAATLTVGGGSYSIQIWVNIAAAAGIGRGGICKNDSAVFAQKEFWVGTKFTSSNCWAWAFYDSSQAEKVCQTATTTASGWHHLVATWDGTTQKMYVDNSSPTTNVPGAVGVNSSSGLLIGADGNSNSPAAFITGSIDQAGIWKGRVLSAADVTLLYNSGAGLSYAAMA